MNNTTDTLLGYEVRDVLTGRLVAEIEKNGARWDVWVDGGDRPALRAVDWDTVEAFVADQLRHLLAG